MNTPKRRGALEIGHKSRNEAFRWKEKKTPSEWITKLKNE